MKTIKNEYRELVLRRWRYNRLHGISNMDIPSRNHIIISRYLTGELAEGTIGSSDASYRLYQLFHKIMNHQEPNGMAASEPINDPFSGSPRTFKIIKL